VSQGFGQVFILVVDHVIFAGHGWIGERDGFQPAGFDFFPGDFSGYQGNTDSLFNGPLDGAIAGQLQCYFNR